MTTLERMVGRLVMSRPGLDRALAISFLNERMRSALHRWPDWAGLVARTTVSIPDAYITGSVSLTTGSSLVTGDTTNAWPVSDRLNTTLVTNINVPGGMWVQLASVQNIIKGSVLYLDGGNANPETLPVLDVIPSVNRVYIVPLYSHPQGAPVTMSSLASLQFRVNGSSPIFTVWAVTSPNTLVITPPWGDTPLPGAAYQILLMYSVIAPDVDSLQIVFDPVQSIKLRLDVPQEELAIVDPTRQAVDSPTCISPIGPNPGGLMLYEIFPAQSSSRQLGVLYRREWPNMRLPYDMPPPWLSENILIYGGLASAYSTPCPRGPEGKDPGYSLPASLKYEQLFENAYLDSLTHDQAKSQTNFTWDIGRMYDIDDGTEGALYGAIAAGAGGGQSFPNPPTPPPTPPTPPTPGSATGSLTNPNIPDGTVAMIGTITLNGATVGMPMAVGSNPALPPGAIGFAQVTGINTIGVYVWNLSGATLPGSTFVFTVSSLSAVTSGSLGNPLVPDGTASLIGTIPLSGATPGLPIAIGASPSLPTGVSALAQVTGTGQVAIYLWALGIDYGSASNNYSVVALSPSVVPTALANGVVNDGTVQTLGTIAVSGATMGTPLAVGVTPPLPIGVAAFAQITVTGQATVYLRNLSGSPYPVGANTYAVATI